MDAKIQSIADRKITDALAAKSQVFGYRVADLHGQAVKQGGAGGSAHQQVIRDACITELRERLQSVWEILRSIAIDFHLQRSADIGEELKTIMRERVANSMPDLRRAIELTKGQSQAQSKQDEAGILLAQVLPGAEADVDLFISTPMRAVGTNEASIPIDVRKIFLSHAAADAPVATFLKEELERRLTGVSVFCSSYPGDIRLGFLWSPEVQRNLQEAGTLVLIATTRSIQRNWVWFESGVFWFDRPIIICCCGELTPEGLPPPLKERQATRLATEQDFKFLLEQLSQITGASVADAKNTDASAAQLVELERVSQSRGQDEALPIDRFAKIEATRRDKKITSERHDYVLEVKLTNLGNGPLGEYFIELTMPAAVVIKAEAQRPYIANRSDRATAFFRITSGDIKRELYPGDSEVVMTIPYYIDNQIYWGQHGMTAYAKGKDLFGQPVTLALYRSGFQPVKVERPFKDFQNF